MLRKILGSLRFRMIALGFLAALPALGLVVYTGNESRQQAAKSAEAEALRLTHLIAEGKKEEFGDFYEFLSISASISNLPFNDPGTCGQFLFKLKNLFHEYASLGVADPKGEVLCSYAPLRKPSNIASRDYFQRAVEYREISLGQYEIDPISGKPVIISAYPIVTGGSRLSAVLFAALDLENLYQMGATASLPLGSEWMAIDRNGTVLARYPDPQGWTGKRANGVPIVNTILTEREEGTTTSIGLDEVERLYAFSPLSDDIDAGMYLSIGIPTATAYAEANREMITNLMGLGAVLLLALFAFWFGSEFFFLRRIRAVIGAASKLAKGDLSARTGLPYGASEFGQLSQAFDDMADALQHSETQYRSLVDNALVGIYKTNLDGEILYANDALARMMEFESHQEMISTDVLVRYKNPEDRAVLLKNLRDAGKVESFEIELVTNAGNLKNVYLSAVLNDEVLSGVIVDITERKRAETLLAKSEEHNRTLVENIPIGVYRNTPGPEGEFQMANPASLAMFGYESLDELKQVRVKDFYANPEERRKFSEDLLSKGSVTGVEMQYRRKDGTTLWGSVTAKVEYDPNGKPLYFDGTIEDITRRKQAEDILAQNERKYRSLFEGANDAILLLDLDGVYLDANSKATDLLGYRLNELIGMSLKDVVAPPEYPGMVSKLEMLLEGHSLPLFERLLRKKDGTEFPVEINISVIKDPQGNPLYIQSMIRDITERKQAERELREINRAHKVLSECNQVLVHTTDEGDFLEEICRVIVVEGGYRLAWVGYTGQDEGKTVQPVAQKGLDNGYFDTLKLSWSDNLDGQCPAGSAIRTGEVVIVDNLRSYPHPSPWFPQALEIGANACISLPLSANGASIGALTICAENQDTFHNEEVSLLRELADDLAYGIVSLRTREEHRIAGERIKRQVKNLEALRNIDIAITSSLDIRLTFEILLSEATHILGVDAATVLLYNPHSQTLDFVSGRGFKTIALQHTHLRLGEGYAGQAARERRTFHIQNLKEKAAGFERSPYLAQEGFVEYVGVPLIAKGQIKGVLEIFNHTPLDTNPEWFGMLEALAGQASIAIDNLELFQNLESSHANLVVAYDSTLEGWSRALDLRDKETEGHTQRVADLSVRLARAMGLENGELVDIRRGALLHDIGKMGIPDKILHKPGPLTDEEWEIMRKHPVYAYELLSPIAYLRPSLDIPYCHHEKWDGSGYPRRLKGESIPLAARIFAVVDVWDALRSDRPYREAWSEERAIAYIQEQAGRHFDPKVVEAFLEILAEIPEE